MQGASMRPGSAAGSAISTAVRDTPTPTPPDSFVPPSLPPRSLHQLYDYLDSLPDDDDPSSSSPSLYDYPWHSDRLSRDFKPWALRYKDPSSSSSSSSPLAWSGSGSTTIIREPFSLLNLSTRRPHAGPTMISIVDSIDKMAPDDPEPITRETVIYPTDRTNDSLNDYMRSFKIPYFESRWGEFSAEQVSLRPSRPPAPHSLASSPLEDTIAASRSELDIVDTPKTPPSSAQQSVSLQSSLLSSARSQASSYGDRGIQAKVDPLKDVWDIQIWGTRPSAHRSPTVAQDDDTQYQSSNPPRCELLMGRTIEWNQTHPAVPGQYFLVSGNGLHAFDPSECPDLCVASAEARGRPRPAKEKTQSSAKGKGAQSTRSTASATDERSTGFSKPSSERQDEHSRPKPAPPNGPPAYANDIRRACPNQLITQRDTTCYICGASSTTVETKLMVAHILPNACAAEIHSKYRCAFDPDAYFPAYPWPGNVGQPYDIGVNNPYIGWRLPVHPSNLMLCCHPCERSFDRLHHGMNVFREEPSRVRIPLVSGARTNKAVFASERAITQRVADTRPFAHLYPHAEDPHLELHRSALPSPLLLTIQFVQFLHACFLCPIQEPHLPSRELALKCEALLAARGGNSHSTQTNPSASTMNTPRGSDQQQQHRLGSGNGGPNDSSHPDNVLFRSAISDSVPSPKHIALGLDSTRSAIASDGSGGQVTLVGSGETGITLVENGGHDRGTSSSFIPLTVNALTTCSGKLGMATQPLAARVPLPILAPATKKTTFTEPVALAKPSLPSLDAGSGLGHTTAVAPPTVQDKLNSPLFDQSGETDLATSVRIQQWRQHMLSFMPPPTI